jgi:hypothetical protein
MIDNSKKLGGPGVIVEIVNGQWVFGGYERGTGRIFRGL